MKKNSITRLFLLSVLVSSSSFADVYVGAGLGYSKLDDACLAHQMCDDEHIAGNLHFGYKVNDYFSTEFNTDYLGEFTVNRLDSNIISAKDLSLWALSLAPKISLPITNAFAMYGKIGGSYLVAGEESDIVPTASLGAEYKIEDNVALQIEYQRFQNMTSEFIDNMDVNLVSLRVNYLFGADDELESSTLNTKPEVETRPVTEIITHTMPEQTISMLFGSDQTEINIDDSLSTTIDLLNQHPQSVVRIEGHTDSTGSKAYNQKLSENRAQFIANQVASHGVEQERITVIGMGESQPVADNHTAQGREDNRRVEITIPSFEYQESITVTDN